MANLLAPGYVSTNTILDTDVIPTGENFATSPAWKLKPISAYKAMFKTYFDTLYAKEQLSYVSTNLSKTSDTALANVTGLSATVLSSGVYAINSVLFTTSGASGGAKVSISGTCTATSIQYRIHMMGATVGSAAMTLFANASALDTSGGLTSIVTSIHIYGAIIVNAGGTLTVQFAQNASNGTASTVYAGSWLSVKKMN